MITLAEKLGETTPHSLLVRKAAKLGMRNMEGIIGVAVARGCRHYGNSADQAIRDPGREVLSDEELVTLLISGEHAYDPTAIRCAAQLARARSVQPARLAGLALRYKTQRVLAHIARAGVAKDDTGAAFWQEVLSLLPPVPDRPEPDLPHWSRFVSMPGFQRHGPATSRWLVPVPPQ